MFTGTFAAIATPFAGGLVDEDALRRLAGHLISNGVDGLVACGTTGEAPTLSVEEWHLVVSVCREVANDRPVIAGTGTNDTRTVIARCRLAAELGADAALVVTPYYNKPTQRGLQAHYHAVADEGGLPIVLYNVPSRTGVNLLPETVATLSHHPRIVAIKDAAGSMDQFSDLLRMTEPGFAVLSGDDSLCLPLYALGGHGVISTTATAAPRVMSLLFSAVRDGNLERARQLHFQLVPLFKALFAETNPGPLKFALSQLGFGSNELRLPLVPVASATEELVRTALLGLGLIPGDA